MTSDDRSDLRAAGRQGPSTCRRRRSTSGDRIESRPAADNRIGGECAHRSNAERRRAVASGGREPADRRCDPPTALAACRRGGRAAASSCCRVAARGHDCPARHGGPCLDARLARIEQQVRELADAAGAGQSDPAAIAGSDRPARQARKRARGPARGDAADPALANRIATHRRRGEGARRDRRDPRPAHRRDRDRSPARRASAPTSMRRRSRS